MGRGLTGWLARTPKRWVRAVDGVSFTLARGEMLALVGESGCGKTTTAQSVLGMMAPAAGTIKLDGDEITGLPERRMRPLRRRLQMIYQDPYESLDPRFRVAATVEEPMLVHGIGGSRAQRRDAVAAALERAGLAPAEAYLERYPHELSGGQRQRVAIAAALAPDSAEDTGPGYGDQRHSRRRAAEHLIALVLPAALSLAAFGPWIFGRMTSHLLSATTQDGTIFVWMYRWWPCALSHHLNPFFTKMAWAPQGINLAWVTSIPGPAVVMAPVTRAFGAIFSFNALQLAVPVLASWTAYLLCRRIVASFWPALAGGLFFGFCPDLIDELGQGHPNLALAFLIPVAAYLVLRLLEGSLSWRWFVPLLGIVLAAQLSISTEVAVTLTFMGAIYALLGWVFASPGQRRRLLRAAGPVLGGYAVAAVLAVPLMYVAFTRPRPSSHSLSARSGTARTVQGISFVTSFPGSTQFSVTSSAHAGVSMATRGTSVSR